MKGVWAFLGVLLPLAAWAEPTVRVEQADGKVIVTAHTAKLVAWRAARDVLVVLAPKDGGVEVAKLPAGVTAEMVESGGLQGVAVRGMAGSWKAVKDGNVWLLRAGQGVAAQSAVMLRDRWLVGDATLVPQTVNVLGKNWQVGLAGAPFAVEGTVVGAVRLGTKNEVAKAVEMPLAAVEPAAGVEEHVGEPSAEVAKKVVAAPEMKVAGASDLMARGDAEAGGHVPAALPSLPQKGRMVAPAMAEETGLGKVAIHPAPAMQPLAVGGVSSEILPKVLTDVYLPGTLVSLTLPETGTGLGRPEAKAEETQGHEGGPAAEHGGEDHGVVEASATEPSVTEPPLTEAQKKGGTWNQVTLKPIEEQMAAAKAKAEADAQAKAGTLPTGQAPDMGADMAEAASGNVNRVLPARGEHYVSDVQAALRGIAEAQEGSTRARDGELYLAGVYLNWHRPEEAMGALGELPVREDGLPDNAKARLLMGLAKLAMDKEPERGLFDQGGVLAPHAQLWRAVAASQSDDYTTALKLWPKERGLLPQYPAYLRERAQVAQATALVFGGTKKVATQVLDEMVKEYKDEKDVPASLNRLRGLVRMGTPDESKGLEYLAAAAQDGRDPITQYRAKFEFVRALYQRHDLNDEQARNYLSDLWFDWRGDELEVQILDMLAGLYEKAGESRQALQYWQILAKAFPRAPELRAVADKMSAAFLHVFDPENPHVYDPLSYIGIYYDFSELVPANDQGDLIHEQVAKLLINANLWDRAAPILEQQLKFRKLDPANQGRLALMLARVYGNMGRAADGLKTIDQWEKQMNTTVLARQRKLVEGDLLLKLKRPEAVLKALAAMPADDEEARDLKIEAAWMAQDWKAAVPLLEAKLQGVTPADLAKDHGAQVAAFRLGFAYGELRDAARLDALTNRYAEVMGRVPQLADGLGAVAAGMGISATIASEGKLAPLTTQLSALNRLGDRIEARREEIAGQRKALQEYDDKMKYMDLLPPPAI